MGVDVEEGPVRDFAGLIISGSLYVTIQIGVLIETMCGSYRTIPQLPSPRQSLHPSSHGRLRLLPSTGGAPSRRKMKHEAYSDGDGEVLMTITYALIQTCENCTGLRTRALARVRSDQGC